MHACRIGSLCLSPLIRAVPIPIQGRANVLPPWRIGRATTRYKPDFLCYMELIRRHSMIAVPKRNPADPCDGLPRFVQPSYVRYHGAPV